VPDASDVDQTDLVYVGSSARLPIDGGVTIEKGDQTITFDPIDPKTYGDPPFAVTATASSGLTVTFTSDSPSVCSVSGSTVTIVAAGDCIIRASQDGDDTWAAVTKTKTVSVGPAATTTTLSCPASVTYTGSAIEPCSATLTIDGAEQSLAVTYSGNTAVGTATATASYAGDGNHAPSSDSKTFQITQALVRAEYTGDYFVLSGTAPSFSLKVVGTDGNATSIDPTGMTATFYVFPAGCSGSCLLTQALWTSPSTPVVGGAAQVGGPATLADDAYIVIGVLSPSAGVIGQRAVGAFAIYPGNSTYVVGGGNVDDGANDHKGFFGFNVKKAKNSAIGSVAYIYRVRIKPTTSTPTSLDTCTTLGSNCRDVYVLVRSTTLTSASTTQSSTWPVEATATGNASLQFMDAVDGTLYDLAPNKPTFRYDAFDHGAGGDGDTFGFSVYTTSGKTTTLYHAAANGPNPQDGTSSATNQVQIGGVGAGADINAPPGNKSGQ